MTDTSTHSPEVSAHFARRFMGRAAQRGLAESAMLQAMRLTREQLSDQRTRISPQQLGALMRLIWRELDDELMGFSSIPHRHGYFALMARQMVAAQTLGEALRYSCLFVNRTSHALQWQLAGANDRAQLQLTLLPAAQGDKPVLEEFFLLVWHRFSNWLVGERIPLLTTHFNYPVPEHGDEYRLMFPGPLNYDSPVSAIEFDKRWLASPVVRSRQELRRYLQRLPDDWFIKQAFVGSVSEQVLQALAEQVEAPSLEQLAGKWQVSSRTLHRQLKLEGTSYRKLLEQYRRGLATGLLLDTDMQIREIAARLGMTEPAFSRAFKQWTGQPPLSWRRHHRE
jgi:AraC-like DNA-binding protein